GYVYNDDKLGSYYSCEYGSAHIAVLNTNDVLSDGVLSTSQVTWLRDDLGATDAKWKIVVMDDPVFTAASENTAMEKQLMNLFADLDVDLVLQGGAKAYYCSHLIADAEYQPLGDKIVRTLGGKQYEALVGDGFMAVAPGTSGLAFGTAQENKDNYDKAFTQTNPVYAAVTVYENDITVETYAVTAAGGRTRLDGAAIEKKGTRLMLGDIDADGRVTTADARLALRYAVKLQSFTKVQKLAADVDMNRTISVVDARTILRAAVGLEDIRPTYKEYFQKDLDNIDF
ncbi:MAG: hypothetical protein IKS78_03450, partial [Clostridia bacterium]|nr:hypothetical protein [Clostridia bacterium]